MKRRMWGGQVGRPRFAGQFVGKTSLDGVDAVAGATISSNAAMDAVQKAIDAFSTVKGRERNEGKLKVFSNGLLKENPSAAPGAGHLPHAGRHHAGRQRSGHGPCGHVVLVCSNIAISALRKIIPDKVRLPAYITVIATFVTVLQMLVKAFVPALDSALGIFLPLIVVNCIILGRAEMFASKNSIGLSALDGLGMGLGFTGTLVVMGSVREVLGAGTLFGIQVMPAAVDPMTVFITPPGGFFVFGCLMALVIWIEIKTNNRKVRSIGCEGCPSASVCGGKCADKAEGGEA